MRVICIRDEEKEEVVVPSGKYCPKMPRIPEGTICTVIDESVFRGLTFYMFAEYYDAKYHYWYQAQDFIPLSNKDEMEIVKERNECTVA